MNYASFNVEPTQPKPLRVIAAITSTITLIIAALPTFGVPLTAEAAGWIVGIVGATASVAVAVFGEPQVTPVSSPRDNDGTPLVRARSSEKGLGQ